MRSYPDWQYNEMKHVGTDYNDPAQVEVYDSQMGTLRDIKKENEEIIKTLNNCKKVFAVDVSPRMLEFAQKKAESKGILNIEFHKIDSPETCFWIAKKWREILLKRYCLLF